MTYTERRPSWARFFSWLTPPLNRADRRRTRRNRKKGGLTLQVEMLERRQLFTVNLATDDEAVVAYQNVAVDLDVLANDDLSGGPLTITAAGGTSHGSVSVIVGQHGQRDSIRYNPNEDFTGTDSFTYTVIDAHGQTSSATVEVTILGGQIVERRGVEVDDQGHVVTRLADGTVIDEGQDFTTVSRGNYTIEWIVDDQSQPDENPGGENRQSQIVIIVTTSPTGSWTYTEQGRHTFDATDSDASTGRKGEWDYLFTALDEGSVRTNSYTGSGAFETWAAGDLEPESGSSEGVATTRTGSWAARDDFELSVTFGRDHDLGAAAVTTGRVVAGEGTTRVVTTGTDVATDDRGSITTTFMLDEEDAYQFQFLDDVGLWVSVETITLTTDSVGSWTESLPGGQMVTDVTGQGADVTVSETELALARDGQGIWATTAGTNLTTLSSVHRSDYVMSGAFSLDSSTSGDDSGSGGGIILHSGTGSGGGSGSGWGGGPGTGTAEGNQTLVTTTGTIDASGWSVDRVRTTIQAVYDVGAEDWTIVAGTGSASGSGEGISGTSFAGSFASTGDGYQSSGTFIGSESEGEQSWYATTLTLDEEEVWQTTGVAWLRQTGSGSTSTTATVSSTATSSGAGTSTVTAAMTAHDEWSQMIEQDLVIESNDSIWATQTLLSLTAGWVTTTTGTIAQTGGTVGSGSGAGSGWGASTATFSAREEGELSVGGQTTTVRIPETGLRQSLESTHTALTVQSDSSASGTAVVGTRIATFSQTESARLSDDTLVVAWVGETEQDVWFTPTIDITSTTTWDLEQAESVAIPTGYENGVPATPSLTSASYTTSAGSLTTIGQISQSDDSAGGWSVSETTTWSGWGETTFGQSESLTLSTVDFLWESDFAVDGASAYTTSGSGLATASGAASDSSGAGSSADQTRFQSADVTVWTTSSAWTASERYRPTIVDGTGSGGGGSGPGGTETGDPYTWSASGHTTGAGIDTTGVTLDQDRDVLTGSTDDRSSLTFVSEYVLSSGSTYDVETESGGAAFDQSGGTSVTATGIDSVSTSSRSIGSSGAESRLIQADEAFATDTTTVGRVWSDSSYTPPPGTTEGVLSQTVAFEQTWTTDQTLTSTSTLASSLTSGSGSGAGLWMTTASSEDDAFERTEWEQSTDILTVTDAGLITQHQGASGRTTFTLDSLVGVIELEASDGSREATGSGSQSATLDEHVEIDWSTHADLTLDGGTLVYDDSGLLVFDSQADQSTLATLAGQTWTVQTASLDSEQSWTGHWDTTTLWTPGPTAGFTGYLRQEQGGSGNGLSHAEYRYTHAAHGDTETATGDSTQRIAWYDSLDLSVSLDDEADTQYHLTQSHTGEANEATTWSATIFTFGSGESATKSGVAAMTIDAHTETDFRRTESWSFTTPDPTDASATPGRLATTGLATTTATTHDTQDGSLTLTLGADDWEITTGSMILDGSSSLSAETTVTSEIAAFVDGDLRVTGTDVAITETDAATTYDATSIYSTVSGSWVTLGSAHATQTQRTSTSHDLAGSSAASSSTSDNGVAASASLTRSYLESTISTDVVHTDADYTYAEGWKPVTITQTQDGSSSGSAHYTRTQTSSFTTDPSPPDFTDPDPFDPASGLGDLSAPVGSTVTTASASQLSVLSTSTASHAYEQTATYDSEGVATTVGTGQTTRGTRHQASLTDTHVSLTRSRDVDPNLDKNTLRTESHVSASDDLTGETVVYTLTAAGTWQVAAGSRTTGGTATSVATVSTWENRVAQVDGDLIVKGTHTRDQSVDGSRVYVTLQTFDDATGQWATPTGSGTITRTTTVDEESLWAGSDSASGSSATTNAWGTWSEHTWWRDREYAAETVTHDQTTVTDQYTYNGTWTLAQSREVSHSTGQGATDFLRTGGSTNAMTSGNTQAGSDSSGSETWTYTYQTQFDRHRDIDRLTVYGANGQTTVTGTDVGSHETEGEKTYTRNGVSDYHSWYDQGWMREEEWRDGMHSTNAADHYEYAHTWNRDLASATNPGGSGSGGGYGGSGSGSSTDTHTGRVWGHQTITDVAQVTRTTTYNYGGSGSGSGSGSGWTESYTENWTSGGGQANDTYDELSSGGGFWGNAYVTVSHTGLTPYIRRVPTTPPSQGSATGSGEGSGSGYDYGEGSGSEDGSYNPMGYGSGSGTGSGSGPGTSFTPPTPGPFDGHWSSDLPTRAYDPRFLAETSSFGPREASVVTGPTGAITLQLEVIDGVVYATLYPGLSIEERVRLGEHGLIAIIVPGADGEPDQIVLTDVVLLDDEFGGGVLSWWEPVWSRDHLRARAGEVAPGLTSLPDQERLRDAPLIAVLATAPIQNPSQGGLSTREMLARHVLSARDHGLAYAKRAVEYEADTYRRNNPPRFSVGPIPSRAEKLRAYRENLRKRGVGEVLIFLAPLLDSSDNNPSQDVRQAMLDVIMARGAHQKQSFRPVRYSSARYIFDGRSERYRDAATGRFVAARDLPWPPNGGFVYSNRQTVQPGTILDRYGNPSGRFLGEPGASISQRGMAQGAETMPYTKYRVVKSFEAQVGPAAAVPDFGAVGGATQYLPGKSVQWLLDNGYLEIAR